MVAVKKAYLVDLNFIAHIQLSGDHQGLLVGNYIADLIRQKDLAGLPKDMHKGVMLHRFIDSFTDNHAMNKKALELLYTRHRKYAPVLLDIYYDYFLIRHWHLFSSHAFDWLCDRTYMWLEDRITDIPKSARANIDNLLNKKWLTSAYGTIEGLEKTFFYLKNRLSKPDYLIGASQTLIDLDAELNSAFLAFYPQLVEAVAQHLTRSTD